MKIQEDLNNLREFPISEKLLGVDGLTGIAYDDSSKRFCLITLNPVTLETSFRKLPHRDILAVELVEDGTAVIKTSRVSQLGGILVGGVVAGGIGAVIGGLSGKRSVAEKVSKIELRLLLNDTQNPSHVVVCMDTGSAGFSKSGFVYRSQKEAAMHWHDLIKVLVNQVDSEGRNSQYHNTLPTQQYSASSSVADELTKLVSLLEKGTISHEEFATQKRKLLS